VSVLSPLTSDDKAVTANCPSGKKVLGGGGVLDGQPQLGIFQSYPPNDASWTVYAKEIDDYGDNWAIRTYAVCADVTP
jgi:hypothetical protein